MRDQAERFLRSLRVGELLEAREIIEELLRAAEESPEAAPAAQGPATERRRFSRHTLSLPVTYFRHRAAGSPHRSAAGAGGGWRGDWSALRAGASRSFR